MQGDFSALDLETRSRRYLLTVEVVSLGRWRRGLEPQEDFLGDGFGRTQCTEVVVESPSMNKVRRY